jgi:hypothetical protein
LEGEADDEQTDGLATVLSTLREKWPKGFKASDVSSFLKGVDTSGDFEDDDQNDTEFKEALEQASGKLIRVVSAKVLNWRLRAIVDDPVDVEGGTLVLRYTADTGGHGGQFRVEKIQR